MRRPGHPSEPPGLDCLQWGHMLVRNVEFGAWQTSDGELPSAEWCLYCGAGSSNEELRQPHERGD